MMKKTLYTVVGVVAIVAVLICGTLIFIRISEASQGNFCNNQLRQIDGAKEQAKLELGLKNGDLVSEEQVAKYCYKGVIPVCPSGGKYTINPIGKDPTCSLRNPNAPVEKRYWHNLASSDE